MKQNGPPAYRVRERLGWGLKVRANRLKHLYVLLACAFRARIDLDQTTEIFGGNRLIQNADYLPSGWQLAPYLSLRTRRELQPRRDG